MGIDPEGATVVIANPAAAAGRVGRRSDRIERTLRSALGPFELWPTRAAGHAAELASQAVGQGVARILALGGDGTLSEVVHGVVSTGCDPGAVCVGLLPAGTGGDFRRLLGDEWAAGDLRRAAIALADADATPVDVGHVRFEDHDGAARERFFLNILSFGIGGLVDRLVNESPKHLGGRASFFLGTFRAALRYRPARVALRIDGAAVGELEVTNIFVCNGRFGGGGMHFGPDALLDDGLFDVVCIEHRSLPRTLAMTRGIYRGRFDHFEGVHRWRGRRVEARTLGDAEALIDLDGEAPGRLPAEITLRPRAVRILGVRPGVLERSSQ